MDEPIQVEKVVRIRLEPFIINGVSYWLNSEHDKIYKHLSNGRMEYIGVWDGEAIQKGRSDEE